MWQRYQPFKWWLLPHGIAGACALLLGPMQFSDRLRLRYAKLHRVVGRVYVAGAFIASPMGMYIEVGSGRWGAPLGSLMISVTHGGLWMSNHRNRPDVHPEGEGSAASAMDDAQLSRGAWSISGSPSTSRCNGCGKHQQHVPDGIDLDVDCPPIPLAEPLCCSWQESSRTRVAPAKDRMVAAR